MNWKETFVKEAGWAQGTRTGDKAGNPGEARGRLF